MARVAAAPDSSFTVVSAAAAAENNLSASFSVSSLNCAATMYAVAHAAFTAAHVPPVSIKACEIASHTTFPAFGMPESKSVNASSFSTICNLTWCAHASANACSSNSASPTSALVSFLPATFANAALRTLSTSLSALWLFFLLCKFHALSTADGTSRTDLSAKDGLDSCFPRFGGITGAHGRALDAAGARLSRNCVRESWLTFSERNVLQ